jgi:hypothetical protein
VLGMLAQSVSAPYGIDTDVFVIAMTSIWIVDRQKR